MFYKTKTEYDAQLLASQEKAMAKGYYLMGEKYSRKTGEVHSCTNKSIKAKEMAESCGFSKTIGAKVDFIPINP